MSPGDGWKDGQAKSRWAIKAGTQLLDVQISVVYYIIQHTMWVLTPQSVLVTLMSVIPTMLIVKAPHVPLVRGLGPEICFWFSSFGLRVLVFFHYGEKHQPLAPNRTTQMFVIIPATDKAAAIQSVYVHYTLKTNHVAPVSPRHHQRKISSLALGEPAVWFAMFQLFCFSLWHGLRSFVDHGPWVINDFPTAGKKTIW